MDPNESTTRFSWEETATTLEELRERWELSLSPSGKSFVGRDDRGEVAVELRPPLVQRITSARLDPESYLASLPESPGLHLVILVQAGAAAIGVGDEGELVRHKAIKKYMVRGKGKYQGTFLSQKGKSRYGSRLRLRNATLFFEEINERLADWTEEFGRFDDIFVSCTPRLWSELAQATTPPPFSKEDPVVRIPIDVRVPCFKELRHVYYELTHGHLLRPES